MIRAGVFIGVDKTGGLQRLHDAADGAERMHAWALEQGMADKTEAKLITDAGGRRVTPDDIYDEIKAIIDGPGAEQLIVYFAGHGVNINRNEQWLLTEAPVRASAAVDVTGSVELARYCGIQHVVIVSDACRVAPEGIQAQNVRGVDIFPNDGAGDRARPVDQFFACLLGRTAAEIKDPALAADNYTALYTRALLDAIEGRRPDLLDPSDLDGDIARYVRVRRLQSYLEKEVPLRVKALDLEQKVNQNPDAIITSDGLWMSRLDRLPRVTRGTGAPPITPPAAPPQTTFRDAVHDVTYTAVRGSQAALQQTVEQLQTDAGPAGTEFAATMNTVASPFGPDHFESECGIKVRGSRIADLFAPRANVELLRNGEALRVNWLDDGATSVLVQLQEGLGTLVPAIPGFIAGLTFEDDELVDVSYEPSANSWRWPIYEGRAQELRALRAVAASSSLHGRFQLDQDDAILIARRLQLAKGVDPTLAVYASYAYHDLQEIDRIREMSEYLRGDIGVTLFDLELLGRRLIDKSADFDRFLVPFTPLLSQGWSLLRAHRFRFHPALDGIEHTMRESVWSLYEPSGVNLLKRALATGDVR